MKQCLMWVNILHFLFLTLALAICSFLLVVLNVKTTYLPASTKYGMVFDAGSAHTDLYIYQWPADKENNTGIVSQVFVCTEKGGISSYADTPAKAGESLKRCLDKAMEVLPAKQQKETPILLGATAGMRLLREKNRTKADQVLAEVSKTIKKYPVDFQGARILTGNEEGSLGWITINYLLESFVKFSFAGEWVHPWSADIVGAMDLGGASTEMTFCPNGQIQANYSEMFQLYGYNYTVYTHSYLCYGIFEALDKLMGKIIEEHKFLNVTHPCYPQGFKRNVSLSALYGNQCVVAPAETPTKMDITVVEGAGDPGKCRSAMKEIFNFSACDKTADCTFDGVYQPPVHGQFYAFSAFYVVFSFLNLTDGQPLSVVNATIWEFCSKNWTELTNTFPAVDKQQLHGYCAASTYILTLLLDGYKFSDQTWKNINFRKQVGSADIGWTLGYMLNMTNKIPSEAPASVKGHDHIYWVAMAAVSLVTALLVFFGIILHCVQKPVPTYETLM